MSEKYQKEIEEILRQAGAEAPPPGRHANRNARPSLKRLIWAHIRQSFSGKALSLSPGRIMLVAVVLLLSALVVRAFSLGFVGPLAWAGLLLFIVAYAMFFLKPPRIEKRWRGQSLDGESDSWWSRFRRK